MKVQNYYSYATEVLLFMVINQPSQWWSSLAMGIHRAGLGRVGGDNVRGGSDGLTGLTGLAKVRPLFYFCIQFQLHHFYYNSNNTLNVCSLF